MKILLISQVFWPDTASTSQHLTDLAERLALTHEVRVISSRHNYENTREKYLKSEERNRIDIYRINNTSFGKYSVISRVFDFFSFNLLLIFKLARISRQNTDLILGMTSPPLVSFFGVFFAKINRIPFAYWTMDLQPELAIASGLIRRKSLAAFLFQKMGNYIFANANKIITLDKYMADYVLQRGAQPGKVSIIPVWPVVDELFTGLRSENPFRLKNNFGDRMVVMYSGNHSFVHPLDTLLKVALRLKNDERFLFVFIGGGVREKDVANFKNEHMLNSIIQLKYEPRNRIHLSLSSADLQVVILGENQVGFTHPNKIYGAMFIGKPILYIGPENSHITDIINREDGNLIVQHEDVVGLEAQLLNFAGKSQEQQYKIGQHNRSIAISNFHPDLLKSKMVEILTSETLV